MVTLDFMVILNMMDCILRPLANKMDGQILAISNNVFAPKILIGSKHHSMQQRDLINSRLWLKFSFASPGSQYCG
jgi:hypothetical protein